LTFKGSKLPGGDLGAFVGLGVRPWHFKKTAKSTTNHLIKPNLIWNKFKGSWKILKHISCNAGEGVQCGSRIELGMVY